jgi:hypothetical protein
MTSTSRHRQAAIISRSPSLERLESRHLLSVNLPGIVATQPADGQVLLQPPQELSVTFNRSDVANLGAQWAGFLGVAPDQILPFLLSLDSNNDLELDRLNSDGTTTLIFGLANPPPQEMITQVADPSSGTTQTELVLPMQIDASSGQAQNLTLSPGTYQLSVSAGTNLDYVFSSAYPQSD